MAAAGGHAMRCCIQGPKMVSVRRDVGENAVRARRSTINQVTNHSQDQTQDQGSMLCRTKIKISIRTSLYDSR